MKNPFSKKNPSQQEAFLRTYLDRIAPGVVKFEVDHYIFGSTYRCVWALRECGCPEKEWKEVKIRSRSSGKPSRCK